MNETPAEHYIGQADQALFDVTDPRERASLLKERLTPKIVSILDSVCGRIREAYGPNSLDPYRIVKTPANRQNAVKTKLYRHISAGLAVKTIEGKRQHWYFQQMIDCKKTAICSRLIGLRGREASPIVTVLNRHTRESVRLLEFVGAFIDQPGIYEDTAAAENFPDHQTLISRLRTGDERDWSVELRIEGPDVEIPITDKDSVIPIENDFLAFFPIFRAATDILQGNRDRFSEYVQQFWDWESSRDQIETGISVASDGLDLVRSRSHDENVAGLVAVESDREEGGAKFVFSTHRERERKLRSRKIREALSRGSGRLLCEVPGCGFDFHEVYGEIGREFAHVHHLDPLGGPIGPRKTEMNRLAIVCANCHAMIHRGGKCRALKELIVGD